jgi:hypothetical protein
MSRNAILPLPFATEELIEIVDCKSQIHLHYLSEGRLAQLLNGIGISYRTRSHGLDNAGRPDPPWNNSQFALGVE